MKFRKFSVFLSPVLERRTNFTSGEIVEALGAADCKASHGRASVLYQLRDAGIPVRLERRYAIHCDKFMVLDGKSVETGAFNFIEAAAKDNAQNHGQ